METQPGQYSLSPEAGTIDVDELVTQVSTLDFVRSGMATHMNG